MCNCSKFWVSSICRRKYSTTFSYLWLAEICCFFKLLQYFFLVINFLETCFNNFSIKLWVSRKKKIRFCQSCQKRKLTNFFALLCLIYWSSLLVLIIFLIYEIFSGFSQFLFLFFTISEDDPMSWLAFVVSESQGSLLLETH